MKELLKLLFLKLKKKKERKNISLLHSTMVGNYSKILVCKDHPTGHILHEAFLIPSKRQTSTDLSCMGEPAYILRGRWGSSSIMSPGQILPCILGTVADVYVSHPS